MTSDEDRSAVVPFDSLPRHRRIQLVAWAFARAIATVAVVVLVYYLLPMDRPVNATTVAKLVLGAIAIVVIIGVQLWQIGRSDYPTLRAVEALGLTIPLYVLTFATTYYLMDRAHTGSFGVPLSKTDTMYFSSTVFTTVGFGDITAKTQAARVVTTCQMWLDLVIVGLVVRLVVNAIKQGQKRHARSDSRDGEAPSGEVVDATAS